MIVKYMKRLFIVLFISLIFISCNQQTSTPTQKEIDDNAQEFVDKSIKKSNVIINGHEYILFEWGARSTSYGNYDFQLEHKIDCKECLSIFD